MDVDEIQQVLRQEFPDLTFRSRPNWTAVLFISMLAGLHISVAAPAFLAGRWEGYLSVVFASILTVAAAVVYHLRSEVLVSHRIGMVRARFCVGRIRLTDRRVRFAAVHAVRVTLGPRKSRDDSFVELLCVGHGGDISCPPSDVPREQALLLAMMLEVPLVKAWDEETVLPDPQIERDDQLDELPKRGASTPG